MPEITRPQVHRIVYELLPRKHWTPAELVFWLNRTQARNAAAKRSHAHRRARLHEGTLGLGALLR